MACSLLQLARSISSNTKTNWASPCIVAKATAKSSWKVLGRTTRMRPSSP